MGQNDRQQAAKEQRRNQAEEKRKLRSFKGSKLSGADWSEVDASIVVKAVEAAAGMGGALRLGYTRDGGAYSVGVYGDGDPFTLYTGDVVELEEMLKGMVEDYGKG